MPDWKYIKYGIEERWERVAAIFAPLREWLNCNPRIVVCVTCVCVLIFLVVVIGILIPDKPPKIEEYKKTWFYDLNTGKLFVAKSDLFPPIEAPSGPLPNGKPAGVRAYVFSYSNNPNESNRFIGFLEKLTPQGREYAAAFRESKDNVTPEAIRQWNKGRLIRRPQDQQWFSAETSQAKAIMNEAYLPNENGESPVYCSPQDL